MVKLLFADALVNTAIPTSNIMFVMFFIYFYKLPCRCGQVYISETCKTLIGRMKEHKRTVQRIDTNNSLAVHIKETSHDILWENAKVLQEEQHKIRRKIKEALY